MTILSIRVWGRSVLVVQFTIEGRPDLDGMHRAVIETDKQEFLNIMKNPSKTLFLRLGYKGKVCGCILQEVHKGKSQKIWLDQYKQRCLNARDGEHIDVEIAHFNYADQAELFVPEDFNEGDLARLIGKPLTRGEKTALYTFSGQPRIIEIISVSADTISILSSDTKIVTRNKKTGEIPITYKDIGGLQKEIQKIREIIEYPLLFPETFEYLGVSQPRGIILYGPPEPARLSLSKPLQTRSELIIPASVVPNSTVCGMGRVKRIFAVYSRKHREKLLLSSLLMNWMHLLRNGIRFTGNSSIALSQPS